MNGQVDRVFATEIIDSGWISVGSNYRRKDLVFTASLLNVQHFEGTVVSLRRVW